MRKKDKSAADFRKKLVMALLVFLFLVLLVSSFFGKRGLIGVFQAQREKNSILEEIELLKKEKARLEKEIQELKENPLAVEEKAREKLWLAKPDEVVFVKSKTEPDKESDPLKKNR